MADKIWTGFKECKVFKKVKEDENVYSFYIKRLDDEVMPEFIAGQFVSIRAKQKDGTLTKPRQYTLSMNYKEDYYRISVKREEEGWVSKVLCDDINEGDTVEMTKPVGKFVLKDNDRPQVLIGGGIGITPMLTMAYDAVKSDRKIYLIYSTRNLENHSFKEEIETLDKENSNLKKIIVYTRPTEDDEKRHDFDLKGRITKEWMDENLPKDADFYFCGPIPFMRGMYHNLVDIGIRKEDINYELFTAGEDITK
ncbi:MAG: FAD-binding oxidoreductase [Clostridiaceae bacterium]|nr:FAD-binding oxidoreductase [Clostridiaceae bacterium]